MTASRQRSPLPVGWLKSRCSIVSTPRRSVQHADRVVAKTGRIDIALNAVSIVHDQGASFEAFGSLGTRSGITVDARHTHQDIHRFMDDCPINSANAGRDSYVCRAGGPVWRNRVRIRVLVAQDADLTSGQGRGKLSCRQNTCVSSENCARRSPRSRAQARTSIDSRRDTRRDQVPDRVLAPRASSARRREASRAHPIRFSLNANDRRLQARVESVHQQQPDLRRRCFRAARNSRRTDPHS